MVDRITSIVNCSLIEKIPQERRRLLSQFDSMALIAPDSGRIRFAGEETPGMGERGWWRERVACVYQKSTLVPTLTVAENLFLNSHPTTRRKWVSWPRLRQQARRVVEEWGLDVDVDNDARQLKWSSARS
jgi:simple sugar transport system ATP-binding protein